MSSRKRGKLCMLHPDIAETGRKQPPNTEKEGKYEKGRIPGSFPLKKRVF